MTTPEAILKAYFGHENFRPLQKEIIQSVLDKQDSIALLPTGGGKSICFQVPALLLPGLCLVVTPLIALMKDQVENLKKKDIPALALYSGMSKKEIEFELENSVNGKYKFLYISPERLMSKHFLDYAIHMELNFLAIDEAHCISQWGYDFRPPYLKIAEFKNKFNDLKCLALTASATPEVVKDIALKLELKNPHIFSKSFTRPNLAYIVQEEEDKLNKMVRICSSIQGSGLVYVKSRKKTLNISQYLNSNGVSADFYHAGLDPGERAKKQDLWIQGKTRIMVCTNAFGMGIDKPDVRFVIHEQKPDTLEAYYQEAGRAGRDGKKAYCILLRHDSDFSDDLKQVKLKYPAPKDIYRVYELICNYLKVAVGSGQGQFFNFDLQEFAVYYDIPPTLVYNVLKILEADAYFQVSESVYLPARIKILCSYNELYEWQLQNEGVDALFKVLLRSYGGLFDFYTGIYEHEIARRLKKSEKWVKEKLSQLKSIDIIDYVPQNKKPQLFFLENRFSSIHIAEERIAYLRKRYLEKLEFMNAYVKNETICRSIQLVRYFGEEHASTCGVCDICLAQKKKNESKLSDQNANLQIKSLISSGRFRIQDLGGLVQAEESEKYLSILRWYKDNGYLKESKEGVLTWTEKKH